jgi:hypothetical protein
MLPIVVLAAFGFGLVGPGEGGGEVPLGRLQRLAERFACFTVIEGNDAGEKMAYADARGHVHVYRFEGGRAVLEWETTSLGSPARGLVATDVDGNGTIELTIATAGGRVLVYDVRTYELLWENGQDPFDGVRCIVVGNVDDDAQPEMVLATMVNRVCLDGLTKMVEWSVEGYADARDMVLGNVDEDEQCELVLNTGVVFDTRHLRAEFESAEPFGDRIDLLDVTGDGVPEVVGEGPDFTLRVFDLRHERELW